MVSTIRSRGCKHGVTTKFQWNNSPEAIANRIISPDVKIFAAREWHKLYEPWAPYDKGHLYDDATFSEEGSMGIITHPGPYSHTHYVGAHWKTGTPFKWKKPLASAAWDQAAKAAGKAEALVQAIQGYIGR